MPKYPTPPGDSLTPIVTVIKDTRRQLRSLQRPDGTRLAALLAQVQAAIANLNAGVATAFAALIASGFSTPGTITAGNLTSGGTVTGAAGVNSIGSYNLDVSTLAGTRRTMWIHQSGAMGYAPSTREKKTNIRPYDKPASAFLACQPKMFEYIAQIDIRDNPENPDYDPAYVVPTDVGELAEDLLDNGLGEFVFYETDTTTVAGIDYISFCAVGMLVIGIDHETRIKALENAKA